MKMRRMTSILLTLCMLLSLIAAAVPTVGATALSGSGTQSDPYRIADASDWATFASNVNSGVDADKYYELTQSISLGQLGSPVTTMVGTTEHPFTGTFDGGGNTLDAWVIDNNIADAAPFHVVASGAVIRDLTVTGTVYASNFGGGIVGTVKDLGSGTCLIEDCAFNGLVSVSVSQSGMHLGGIVGNATTASLTVRNCAVGGQLNSYYNSFIGGIVGWSTGGAVTIENCIFTGSHLSENSDCFHPIALYQSGADMNVTVDGAYYVGGSHLRTDSDWECGFVAGTPVSSSVPTGMTATAIIAPNGNTYYVVDTPNGLFSDDTAGVNETNHFYAKMPVSGTSELDLSSLAANFSFKVYSDGGKSGNYSDNCDGYLRIIAPSNSRIRVSGSFRSEKSSDYLTVIDGDSLGARLIDRATATYNGQRIEIATVYTSGNAVLLYFHSDSSRNYDLFNLTVAFIDESNFHDVTLSPTEHGTVSFSVNGAACTSALTGTTVRINVAPESGYVLDTLTAASGGSAVAVSNNSFTMPAGDVTVTATFKMPIISAISIGATEHGSIAAKVGGGTVTSANEGDVVTLEATPDSGYILKSVSVMKGDTPISVSNNKFTMPDGDVTVTARFGEPYSIESSADWERFVLAVSSGTGAGETWTLDDDVSVTSMVGTEGHPFTGTFDGNGHTLTFNYTVPNTSYQGAAPFRYISGATICDLTVDGSVGGTTHAAGLVGFNLGGSSLIENCAVLTDVRTVIGTNRHIGGVLGHNKSASITMRNVVYGGTLSTDSNFAGGLVGWSDESTVILDGCVFAGEFTGSADFNPVGCKNAESTVSVTAQRVYSTTPGTLESGSNVLIENAYKIVSAGVPDGTLCEAICAPDGVTYVRPCTVVGVQPNYMNGESLSFTVNAPDGTALSGSAYDAALTKDGETVSGLSGAGEYVLTITGASGSGIVGTYTKTIHVWDSIPYVNAVGEAQTPITSFTKVTSTTTSLGSGWYVVFGDVTINARVTVTSSNVNLLLLDGATLRTNYGVEVEGSNALTIWGQSGGTGALVATNTGESGAAVGVIRDSNTTPTCGAITINGGTVDATGGKYAAGIGGASYINGGAIVINGGTVTAHGGTRGAGIGGGPSANAGSVTINGGSVTAVGDDGSAAIGGGRGGPCGTIVINGGTVNAAAASAAGIGTGLHMASYSEGGSVTINGGVVNASGSAGVGGVGVTVTLNYNVEDDTMRVTSNSYDGTVVLSKAFRDLATLELIEATQNADKSALAGKTLIPGSVAVYTIDFDHGDGTGDMASVQLIGGTEYTLPESTFTLPSPERTFVAWVVYDDWNGSRLMYPGDTLILDHDTQITARYKTDWAVLQTAIDEAEDGGIITLQKDIVYSIDSDPALTVGAGKNVTLDLNGHTIDRGLDTPVAGGNAITVSGTLTICDTSEPSSGTITGGAISGAGGAIRVLTGGTLNFESGMIVGNTATNGGAIYNVGIVNISGGIIRDNSATNSGGGIFNNDAGTVNLTGGTITGNECSANYHGGGIHTSGALTVSGSPVVSGNTRNGSKNNIGLYNGALVTIAGVLTDDAELYVHKSSAGTTAFGSGVFTSGLNGGDLSAFHSDRTGGYYPVLDASGEGKIVYCVSLYFAPGSMSATGSMGIRYVEPNTACVLPENEFTYAGYEFAGWKFGTNVYQPGETITVTTSTTVTAMWNQLYTITVNGAANGSVSASAARAIAGSRITLTVDADQGCALRSLSVKRGNKDVALTANGDGTYAFTMPAANVTVTANIAAIRAVALEAPTGGTLTADVTEGFAGDTVTLMAVPAADYVFSSLTVSYTDGENGQQTIVPTADESDPTVFTFALPEANVTVTAIFAPITYEVEIISSRNGTVTTDKAFAAYGETVTLTVTPDANCVFGSIEAAALSGGVELTEINGGFTFTMPRGDVLVTSEFRQVLDLGENVVYFIRDDNVCCLFEPVVSGWYRVYSTGDEIDTCVEIRINDEAMAYSDEDGDGSNFDCSVPLEAGTQYEFWFHSYDASGEASVFLAPQTSYPITLSVPEGQGSVLVTSAAGVAITDSPAGEVVRLRPQPAPGQAFTGFVVTDENGDEVTVEQLSYNREIYFFTMPASAVTVTASFETASMLTLDFDEHVSASKESVYVGDEYFDLEYDDTRLFTAVEGDNIRVTFGAKVGFILDKATLNGVDVTADLTGSDEGVWAIEFDMPADGATVCVTTKRGTYPTVTVGNNPISPEKSFMTYTFTPDQSGNYEFTTTSRQQWVHLHDSEGERVCSFYLTIDADLHAGETYYVCADFDERTSDDTLVITFEYPLTDYTVTVDPDIVGAAVSVDKQIVFPGSNVYIDVFPERGYEIAAVTYNDGTEHVVKLNSFWGWYCFEMPSANVTVSATMIEKPAAPVIALIDAVGTVTLDSKAAIEAAEAAYEDLTDNMRDSVTNRDDLFAARAAYDTLVIIDGCAAFMGAAADSAKTRADLYFAIPDGADPADFTVAINGGEPISLDTMTPDENGYKFSILVPAKNMGDKIAYLLSYKGAAAKSGAVSIADYANNLSVFYPQYARFAGAMLTYGAAAQNYFGYNVAALVSDALVDTPIVGERFDYAEMQLAMFDDSDVPVVYSAMNVTCLADTTMSIAFRIKDGVGIDDALAWVVANITLDGAPVTAKVSGSGDLRFVIISKQNIALTEITESMALVVNSVGSYEISVLNYLVAAEGSGNENLKHLTRALYAYSQEAAALVG